MKVVWNLHQTERYFAVQIK